MHAGSHERQCDTTGANGELQRGALANERGEERDGLFLVTSGVGGVVALRHVIKQCGSQPDPATVRTEVGCARAAFADLRLRFDVLTNTKQRQLHR